MNAPPGWAFNPSARPHRLRVLVLASAGLVFATICALHGHGVVAELWEPLPVVDEAGWIVPAVQAPWGVLDVIGFVAIIGFGGFGRDDRWRKHPWAVIAMGVAAALTALSAVVRWVLQYAIVGTTSTAFFLTAALAVIVLAFVEDEVYAAIVHVHRLRIGAGCDDVPYDSVSGQKLGRRTTSWSDYAAASGAILVGIAMMLAANGLPSRAAAHQRFLGGVVVAIGAISLAQVARVLRWLNAAIGVWLLASPMLYGYPLEGALYSMIFGLLLTTVSTVLGSPEHPAKRRRTLRRPGFR